MSSYSLYSIIEAEPPNDDPERTLMRVVSSGLHCFWLWNSMYWFSVLSKTAGSLFLKHPDWVLGHRPSERRNHPQILCFAGHQCFLAFVHAIHHGGLGNSRYGADPGTLFTASSCDTEPEDTWLCFSHDSVYRFHLHYSYLYRQVACVQHFRS